jgi:carbohydrate-binding DOMON domain-containing protein
MSPILCSGRPSPVAERGARRARRGAGLAEILLAMVIFSLVATSYAAVSLRYATRMKTIGAGAARTAAISEYMNRLMSVPFDSLAGRAGTFTTSTGSFPNTRTITVTGSLNTRTVTLIVTPAKTYIKPDTVVLTRVKRITSSPLG